MNKQHWKRDTRTRKRPKAKIHLDSFRTILKKEQIGKRQEIMPHIDTGLKNSLSSLTNWLSK